MGCVFNMIEINNNKDTRKIPNILIFLKDVWTKRELTEKIQNRLI